MIEPPCPCDEEARLAALRALDLLDSPPEQRFDRIAEAAARILGAPLAMVSLVDARRQWFKAQRGSGATRHLPRALSFCGHAILSDDTFIVPDTREDPRFADNPLVLAEPNIRFYVGRALHALDGSRVGTLCIMDRRPRTLTEAELHVVRVLAARAEDELSARRVRLGDCLLLDVIGRGAMGSVYRARDEALERDVAIKLVLRERASDPEFAARFRREARALAAVSHPNVLTIHAVREERGLLYLVFEYLPGGTVSGLARRRGGRLPGREVARLGAQVARGLAAIHAAGLVHRDVKPANILLDAEENPKLADFGLALSLAQRRQEPVIYATDDDDIVFDLDAPTVAGLTGTGMCVGTPLYMAPEQASGGSLDARADLYSLGATLYALVAGRPPFTGPASEVLHRVVNEPPDPPSAHAPDLDPDLDDAILRLLAKDPARRGGGAKEVARALEAISLA
jgi:tRNA A-37 threonylcarbamoyl transferase component Bud32